MTQKYSLPAYEERIATIRAGNLFNLYIFFDLFTILHLVLFCTFRVDLIVFQESGLMNYSKTIS